MRQAAEDIHRVLPEGHAGVYDKHAVRPLIRAILARNVHHGVLRTPLVHTYQAGWAAGEAAAAEAIARRGPRTATKAEVPSDSGESPAVKISPNWEEWTPGNVPAANAAQGLHGLISQAVGNSDAWSTRAAQRGNLLASIEDNRLNRLADAVSQAAAEGATVDQIESTLLGILDDPSWANMVATTELARSMNAATLASYLDAGIQGKACLTAEDDRVCVECQSNEDTGTIPLGENFPAGDPPTHPGCRCALIPEWITITDFLDDSNPVTAQAILDAEVSAEDLQNT